MDNWFHKIREYIFSSASTFGTTSRITSSRYSTRRNSANYSWDRPNYDYWKRAYAGHVPGMELSGLFIRPIVGKISAWSLGRTPSFQCKTATAQTALGDWWDLHHSEIISGYRSALKQGDSMLVINSDLSVTLLPPESVSPIVNEQDFGEIIGWRVRQVFPHPDESARKMTVIDEYYADRRVHSEDFGDQDVVTTVYPNLIGIIPLIHIANQPVDGEVFGHPEAEALVKLFQRYEETLEAAIEGNILQGRPTPVISFKTAQDLNSFWTRYGRREETILANGVRENVDTLSIDLSDVLTVSGADFHYSSPGPFTEDTERLLGLLFYLVLEHIELPEFVFGNAISSSKASAETQMPIFEIFIRMRQKDCLKWILQICDVALGYLSLTKPGIQRQTPTLQWPKLTQNGRLTMESVSWAYGQGLLDERTALLLLPLDIEKPEEILKQAKKDAEKRMKLIEERTPNPGSPTDSMDPSLEQEIEDLDI